jgi:hypothetical protein
MKHLAAYLLLALGGNESPSAKDIKEVLDSVGIEADSDRLDKLLSELKGKDINEVRYRCTKTMCSGLSLTAFVHSSLLQALRSSHPFHLAVEEVVVLLPQAVPHQLQRTKRKRRRKRRKKSPTTTWDSVSSTKCSSCVARVFKSYANLLGFIYHTSTQRQDHRGKLCTL